METSVTQIIGLKFLLVPSQTFLSSSRKTRHYFKTLNNCKIFRGKTLQTWKDFWFDLVLKSFSFKISLAFPIYFLVYFLLQNFLDWIKNSPTVFPMLFDLVFAAFMHPSQRLKLISTEFKKLPSKHIEMIVCLWVGFIIFSLARICLTTTNKQTEKVSLPFLSSRFLININSFRPLGCLEI